MDEDLKEASDKLFKKDYKLAKKRGKDLTILLTVVENLVNGVKLVEKYKDYQLSGTYSGY